MSKMFACKCGEKLKPVEERNWFVTLYKSDRSSYTKFKTEPSQYSTVICHSCQAEGRSNFKYVDKLMQAGRHYVRDELYYRKLEAATEDRNILASKDTHERKEWLKERVTADLEHADSVIEQFKEAVGTEHYFELGGYHALVKLEKNAVIYRNILREDTIKAYEEYERDHLSFLDEEEERIKYRDRLLDPTKIHLL